jgi:hypothetical protein
MRIPLAVAVLAIVARTPALQAQGKLESLRVRRLPGGISVPLPASWKSVSESSQRQVNGVVDTLLGNSSDSVLRAGLRNGRPVFLMNETQPGHDDPSANLNAAPAPGVAATTFDGMSDVDLAGALAAVCPSIRDAIGRMGFKIIACDPAMPDRGAGRTIAITRYVRSSGTGFVTTWLAQYPAKNVLYTLTLTAPQAEKAMYGAMFREIWRAVTISP